MSRFKGPRLFPTFSQMNAPDFKRLSELVRAAMGNRSAITFAKDCSVSQTTILRILNCQVKAPLQDCIIDEIAKNSSPNAGVTLLDLLDANGLVETQDSDYDAHIQKEMSHRARPEYAKRFELAGIKFIEKRFRRLGFEFTPIKEHEFDAIPHFSFDAEYSVEPLNKQGIKNWSFNFIYISNREDKKSFYDKLSRVFASAFLFPKAMSGRAITVLTNYIEGYDDFIYNFCSADVNIPISIIFADVVADRIHQEYQLPTEAENVNIEILKLDKE